MSNMSYPDDAPTWRVLEIREVRATSQEEALEIAWADLQEARKVDTGEVGHVAGGRVVMVIEEDTFHEPTPGFPFYIREES